MEKLIQRTARAKQQAARQLTKVKQRNAAEREWKRRQQDQRRVSLIGTHIREARKNRQVDWETGALAPRRDVGENAERYATMEMYDMNLVEHPPERRLKWWHIEAGDRVVVIRGREKGRIGMVWRVSKRRNSVEINDINVVDFYVPPWVPRPEGDTRKVVGHSQAVPIEDVRLVYPLPDPETGAPKDVVIDRLVPINRRPKDKKGIGKGDRVIAGTNTIIPWPPKPDRDFEDHEDDTLRITVEEQTFRPLLLRPPMPMSVIDELRNKYSSFRTRHEWEFEEKMRQIDANVERRKELPKTMRTPLQELAELKARQKAAQEKELSEVQLAKIGEVIAQERARATDAVKRLER